MENTNKSETILVIVFTFILIGILALIAFNAHESTSSLQQNTSAKENSNNSSSNNSIPNNNVGTSTNNNENEVTKAPVPIETQVAEFSSNIYDKDENRVYNIGLAIEKINGFTIKKGETFSFNETVGPMGQEQGFKEAIGFDTNGKKIKMPGGGMCQISSTIYNAALIANLEILERHPHSRRVYYVPKDKDATIYYNSLDLKFKNNTENDIKVTATNTDSNVTIILNKITFGD